MDINLNLESLVNSYWWIHSYWQTINCVLFKQRTEWMGPCSWDKNFLPILEWFFKSIANISTELPPIKYFSFNESIEKGTENIKS